MNTVPEDTSTYSFKNASGCNRKAPSNPGDRTWKCRTKPKQAPVRQRRPHLSSRKKNVDYRNTIISFFCWISRPFLLIFLLAPSIRENHRTGVSWGFFTDCRTGYSIFMGYYGKQASSCNLYYSGPLADRAPLHPRLQEREKRKRPLRPFRSAIFLTGGTKK